VTGKVISEPGDDLETFRKKFKEHLEAVAPVDKDSDQK
jgi:uncharacterized protein YnzC (UPF0291/DUF896 family)